MGEPGRVHPSMTKADTWPLSAVETVLLATLCYIVLLIGLAGARDRTRPDPVSPAPLAALADTTRPVAAVRHAGLAGCVAARTVPQSYATAPGVRQPLAFGPPVEPAGPLTAAEVNGQLWLRLCGGIAAPGGPAHPPDRRLYVAIDAAVNGGDPNRPISQSEWAAGVERFITHDAIWDRARVVAANVPAGTATFGMRVRRGADPLVVRTRLTTGNTSRYLVLPVRSRTGLIVVVTLRLPCGFQPILG
jgi:hypothetical protein